MNIFQTMAQGNEEAVSKLLDADPTLLEAEGGLEAAGGAAGGLSTPVEWAAYHGQLGLVRLLVQRGANISSPGRLYPALYQAVDGHEDVVAFLLEKGAPVNTANRMGITPLMLASCYGCAGVVRMLLQHLGACPGGLGLDERDNIIDGYAALSYAAHGGRVEVVKLLLLAGADPTIRTNDGATPRALAERRRDEAEEDEEEETRARYVTCLEVFEWWEGELKRHPLLERARCLHDTSTTQRDTPTAPVPAFLQARAAAGQALPQVEVVAGQQEEQDAGARGEWEASSEAGRRQEEEERHAVCGYVVEQLNEELFTELLHGFHAPRLM